jgi:hypothetical protein
MVAVTYLLLVLFLIFGSTGFEVSKRTTKYIKLTKRIPVTALIK